MSTTPVLLAITIIILIINQFQSTTAELVQYTLTLSYFYFAPDGVSKPVLGINNFFPGPILEATKGDFLEVKVINRIRHPRNGTTYPTSIHWHGIEQFRTPWEDGPEGVSQCAIPFGQKMTYRFTLRQSGTYWYHSHHSWQYPEGCWGMLIVHNSPNEVYPYQDELLVAMNDWHHTAGSILADQYHRRIIQTPIPDTGLINGFGSYPCSMAPPDLPCDPSPAAQAPAELFVFPGLTYRIRVINTSARSNFNFSIDGHKLYCTELDGVDTVKIGPVDAVTVWPAQRYSFIVTMNGNLNEYWIRADMNFLATGVQQPKAVLTYLRSGVQPPPGVAPVGPADSPISDGGGTQGRPENHPFDFKVRMEQIEKGTLFVPDFVEDDYTFLENAAVHAVNITSNKRKSSLSYGKRRILTGFGTKIPTTQPNPNPVFLDDSLCRPVDGPPAPNYFDQQITINVTFRALSNPNFLQALMNGNPYAPPIPPVIVDMRMNRMVKPSANPYFTPYGNIVQLVINNQNLGDHPWHLHGHTMWVLGAGTRGTPTAINNFDPVRDAGKLNINGARRDTSATLAWSWMVIRYKADNPGPWLLHCHINWHLEIGLGAVFVEGLPQFRTMSLPMEARRVCGLSNIMVVRNTTAVTKSSDSKHYSKATLKEHLE